MFRTIGFSGGGRRHHRPQFAHDPPTRWKPERFTSRRRPQGRCSSAPTQTGAAQVKTRENRSPSCSLRKENSQMIRHSRVEAIMTKRRLAALVIAAVVPTALAGVALATAPFGIVSAPVVARASFADPVDIKFKVQEGHRQEVIHVRDA